MQIAKRSPKSGQWIAIALLGLAAASVSETLLDQAFPEPVAVQPVVSGWAKTPDMSLLRPPVSLATGTAIAPAQDISGYSSLKIDNGNKRDAVVKLVDLDSGETLRFVYVQANSQFVLENLGTCRCQLMFATGIDWDAAAQRFHKSQSTSAFRDPLEFKREQRADGEYWSGYEITLHTVVHGNAKIEPVSPDEFGTDTLEPEGQPAAL